MDNSGLIDHNHKKGLCLEYAQKLGFQHARLPIPEYVELKTRKVRIRIAVDQFLHLPINQSQIRYCP